MATFREMLVRLGALRTVEPVIEQAFIISLTKQFVEQIGDDPHGRPWHVSFHASSFPGDKQACPRMAMYGLMDIPKEQAPTGRWLHGVAEVGKTKELGIVRAARDAGYLCRSNQPGRSSDPEATDAQNLPMPQMGFEEPETWLTGSVDLPLLPFGYTSTHVGEVKSKHSDKIEEMMAGARSYDEKHKHQVLCSLGMAHDHPDAFLHPTEDRVLDRAVDGSLYYVARDSPWDGRYPDYELTFEFYFEHDPEFMKAGRAQLSVFRMNFIEDHLPEAQPRKSTRTHPNGKGWTWSQGPCKNCGLKKACRADYDAGITKISESRTISIAQFLRPGYDAAAKRAAVFSQWNMADPLIP